MKILVFYNLVLVTTLAVCRSESTTEFCTDRSCPHSTKSEFQVGSSNRNEDQDIAGTQGSLLQFFWSMIKDPITIALGALKNTIYKKVEEYTE